MGAMPGACGGRGGYGKLGLYIPAVATRAATTVVGWPALRCAAAGSLPADWPGASSSDVPATVVGGVTCDPPRMHVHSSDAAGRAPSRRFLATARRRFWLLTAPDGRCVGEACAGASAITVAVTSQAPARDFATAVAPATEQPC